jgi:hypothetical protein
MRYLLAAIACAVALGCREPVEPVAPQVEVEAPVPTLTTDEKVMLALDYYEPMYKVDTNGRVTHLRLSGRHLPSAILAEVGKLTELQGLDLYGTTVNDEGLAHLKNLQKLRSMGLGATQMTDKGLDHLEKLQTLQWVWVPRQSVSNPGVEKLKGSRPDMNIYWQ